MANPQVLYGDPRPPAKKPQPVGGLPAAAPGSTSVPSAATTGPLAGGAGGGMPTAPTTPRTTLQTVGTQSGAGTGGVGPIANGTTSSANAGAQAGDPFAAMGGGVKLASGDWVPKDHPLAKMAAPAPAAKPISAAAKPISAPSPAVPNAAVPNATSLRPPAPTTVTTQTGAGGGTTTGIGTGTVVNTAQAGDPFAAMGGGVKLASGDWVPKDHPLAKQAGATATTPPPTGTSPRPGAATTSADPFAAMGGGVQLPGGEWVPKDHPLAKTAAPPTTTAPGGITTGTVTTTPQPLPAAPTTPTPAAAPATTAAGAPGTTSASPQQVGGAFRDALMKMLGDNQKAPSINDPTLKGQADAYSLAQTRARERARSAMAERRAGEGGTGTSSGAFDQDLVGLFQQQGENEAGFNAGLVGQELQARRNQLMQAAALAGNQLSGEDARALQRELADLDAKIRREGMAQQGGQFEKSLAEQTRQSGVDAELKRLGITTQADLGNKDVALRGELGKGQLNLGLLSALLQNQQFGQRLGADVGIFNSNANTQALLQMLGQL